MAKFTTQLLHEHAGALAADDLGCAAGADFVLQALAKCARRLQKLECVPCPCTHVDAQRAGGIAVRRRGG
jgi:hypothetical protein